MSTLKILGIDTSGGTAGAALLDGDIIRAEININYNKTHSQTLVPMLDIIRNMSGLDMSELDAIAVAAGPGSFTGLRIGSATAKGLGLALDIPVIPVPTLEGLSYRYYGSTDLICPIMDARRSQVYTGVYTFTGSEITGNSVPSASESNEGAFDNKNDISGKDNPKAFKLKTLLDQEAVPIEDIIAFCNSNTPSGGKVIFLGDGVPVYKETIKELIKVPFLLSPPHIRLQSGACVAMRGADLYESGIFEHARDHKPVYLRKPQAEREREQAH